MKSIRTTPTVHAAEGDERIRTAEQALGADAVYVVTLVTKDPLSITTGTKHYRVQAQTPRKAINLAKRDYNRRCAPKWALSGTAQEAVS